MIQHVRSIGPVYFDVNNVSMPRLELKLETGLGSLTDADEKTLQISKDGRAWGNGMEVSIGLEGQVRDAVWTQLGSSKDWFFRWSSESPAVWFEAHASVLMGLP